ncbi:MAG TPA: CocE/NonD family hydrolase [Candidatus Angelobacter sp.]|nr:CocE/NonD family hydrolase [Candidatus Angelobacter sp.]
MKTIAKFPRKIREIENAWIRLKDGCHLAARIWLPEDAEQNPVPAVLEYIPYRKRDGTVVRDHLTHPYLAGHGYAGVRVDMRGSGESDGLMWDEYLKQEQDDALEVIDWISHQAWCTGKVGMMGISWGGFNALQVASRRPPALKAIITIDSTVDRFADDIHYKGGCLLLENLGWSSTMQSYSSRPPDPALVGARWRDMWIVRLKNEPLLLEPWLQHQHRDDYWKHGSVGEDYDAIEAATLAVGGWADAYKNAVPQLVANIRKAPVKGLVGPWLHKYPHFAVPGPAIGFLQEALRWWDQFLKGKDTGVLKDPAYVAYMQDSVPPRPYYRERPGRWIAEDKWPSKSIKPQAFKLNRGSLDKRATPAVKLTLRSPQTTGVAAGEYCPIWLGPEAPVDQRLDDGGSLVFDTPPLAADVEIFGAPELILSLAVDRPQANLAVRLCDVHAGGEATRVTYGLLNLCHRDGSEKPSPLQLAKTYKVRLPMDHVAYRFPKGHRIRVAISTAYWPMMWPSPEPVTLTLLTGKSELSLPVRPKRREKLRPFPEPEGAAPASLRSVREASNSRTVEMDIATGEQVTRIVDDFGETENQSHGLIAGSIAREIYRIKADDPLSAAAETHWTQTLRRADWSVRTEARCRLTADKESFHVTGSVEAYENGRLIHEKKWDSKIKRSLV